MKSQEKTIGEVFDFIGEENLTEENCYNRLGNYPVYSGQTEDDGIVCKVNFYKEEEPCLTFTTYGSAGRLFYRDGKFTIGRNCMGLRAKKEFKDKINLKWFLFTHNQLFLKHRKGDKEGQSLLNKTILENVKFNLPEDIEYQKRVADKYESLINKKINLISLVMKLSSLRARPFSFVGGLKVNQESVNRIFDLVSGNSGLTEEYIYSSIQNAKREIFFLSGSLNETPIRIPLMPHPKKDGNLEYLKEEEGILVIRKGKAGTIRFLPKNNYATNDDAYILFLRKEFKGKINLKWLIHEYGNLFLKYSSSSDNGTWNKGSFFNEAKIKVISKENQDKISSYYDRINCLRNYLVLILMRIDDLLSKELHN